MQAALRGTYDCEAAALTERGAWVRQCVMPHEPSVRQLLSRHGVKADLLEDVLQDAYLRLLSTECVAHVRDCRGYFARAARSVVLTRARRLKCVQEDTKDGDYFSDLA